MGGRVLKFDFLVSFPTKKILRWNQTPIMYLQPCTPWILPHAGLNSKQPAIGSWIASFDANGIPYWTNSVSKETTYRLFVQQTNQPGMPLVPAGNGEIPPWSLPLKVPPAPTKDSSDKGRHCIRVGNWEETYDAVDGKKSWYNTKTKKTTKDDPFW